MKPPKSLKTALWSYDISKFDLKNAKDKRLIITQVLNHGTMRDVKWLLKTYSLSEIKEVVKKPARGVWWKETINYWRKILDVKVDPWFYKFCIFDINPNPKLIKEYFAHVVSKNSYQKSKRNS